MSCERYDRILLMSYSCGDLSEGMASDVAEHLQSCTACAGYLHQIEEERASFLAQLPDSSVMVVRSRLHLTVAPVFRRFALAAVMVLAVGTATLLRFRSHGGYRTKGTVALRLYGQESDGAVPVPDGREFFPGERIQFSYSCGKECYFMLVSIDDSGRVTVFYPVEGDLSIQLEPGADLPLSNSIILDEFIGKELFLGLFSARPLQVSTVVAGIKRTFANNHDLETMNFALENVEIRSSLLIKSERRR